MGESLAEESLALYWGILAFLTWLVFTNCYIFRDPAYCSWKNIRFWDAGRVRLFFSLWNCFMALGIVGPAWSSCMLKPTFQTVCCAICVMILPHVVVGLVVPVVIGVASQHDLSQTKNAGMKHGGQNDMFARKKVFKAYLVRGLSKSPSFGLSATRQPSRWTAFVLHNNLALLVWLLAVIQGKTS